MGKNCIFSVLEKMGKNCIFMQNENFLLKIGGLVLMITAGIRLTNTAVKIGGLRLDCAVHNIATCEIIDLVKNNPKTPIFKEKKGYL